MKLAVFHSSYEGSAVPFKDFDARVDPSRHLPGHTWANWAIAKANAVRRVIEASRQGIEVVVNLCDGAWDEDRAGLEVVQALERCHIAFTGAGSAFYDPSREAMKMACQAMNVRFPHYVVANGPADVERAVEGLRFPMIVKHPNSYSSIGLTRDSRVTDAGGLARESARMIGQFGAALIEEFIEGHEFTVLVTEPRDATELAWALTPVEFCFPEGESFKHFDLKWREFRRMETRVVEDTALAARLAEASTLAFAALGGSGYGRCDFRLDAAGELHLLEINPNCAVFYPEGEYGSADFILACDPAGHRGFLEHLLACALRRRDRARSPAEPRFDRDRGFCLVAVRDIAAGEVVERREDRVRVVMPRHRGEWRPLEHSCDPNAQDQDGHLVARRRIATGQTVTVDYHVTAGLEWKPFECRCAAPNCRRLITPAMPHARTTNSSPGSTSVTDEPAPA